MKKLLIILLTILLTICICINVSNVKIHAIAQKPYVAADGAVLMDAATGNILYSKNMNTPYPPASTTKIMTTLLALENCTMEDKVVIGENPPKTEGNSICLFEGEEFTVKDLLYAVVNESANDCANALAEHISSSVPLFATKMNLRAKELGCRSTNFTNPSGLYNPNHKASAKDLAIIMRELMKHNEIKAITTTMRHGIAPTNKTPRERAIVNHNRLLLKNSGYYYVDCEAGKTGYTIQSMHSFVASAKRDGKRLIVALVHDKKKLFYKDAISLFNYGFENFKLEDIDEGEGEN